MSVEVVEVVSLTADMVWIREANHLVRVFNRVTGSCLSTVTSDESERLRVDKRGRLVVVNTATSRVKVVQMHFDAIDMNEIVHEFQVDRRDSSTPSHFISITEQNELAFLTNGSIITFYKLDFMS